MRTANDTLISESPMSMSWTSEAIHIASIVDYAIQLTYLTSSAVVYLECSCDLGHSNGNSVVATNADIQNWTQITNSVTNLTEDGDITFDVENASYKWVRVVVSGTGFVTSARFNTKG